MPAPLDPHQLLHGPYTPPPLRRGDKATCLFRDGDVIVTSWSGARIPWPRCPRPGSHGIGFSRADLLNFAAPVGCNGLLDQAGLWRLTG